MAFADPQHNIDQFGLAEGMRVADLGAGSGFYSIAAGKKVGIDGKVYAVEIQADLGALVKKKASDEGLSNIEVIRGDLEQVGGSKLQDNFVDAVLLSNIFFQIGDKETFLKEALRILKPGGRAMFIDWSESFGGMGPEADAVVRESVARKYVEDAGFLVEKNISAGDHHYGFVLRKPKGEV